MPSTSRLIAAGLILSGIIVPLKKAVKAQVPISVRSAEIKFHEEPRLRNGSGEAGSWSTSFGGYYVFNGPISKVARTTDGVYVAGAFTEISGVPIARIAKWNGASWEALGAGLNGSVSALVPLGKDLYVAGDFTQAGGENIRYLAKWNGHEWDNVGDGTPSPVRFMAAADTNLYIVGSYVGAPTSQNGINVLTSLSKWNGSEWSSIPGRINGAIYALAANGTGVVVGGDVSSVSYYVEGTNEVAASNTPGIAMWDGGMWHDVGGGLFSTYSTVLVTALTMEDNRIYAAGLINYASDNTTGNVVEWNGTEWQSLGSGVSVDGLPTEHISDIVVRDGQVYVSGEFNRAGDKDVTSVARWDGKEWLPLGGPLNGPRVFDLELGESGIYVCGDFSRIGARFLNSIAEWDDSNWKVFGGSANGGFDYGTHGVAVIGSDVIVGGSFSDAGGLSANHIAKWNGSTWEQLGSGVNGDVASIVESEGSVYAAGIFTMTGNKPVSHIARWDGIEWQALDQGVNGNVNTLYADGNGIYAGGNFTEAGRLPIHAIALWNGSAWSQLGGGLDGEVYAIAKYGSKLAVSGHIAESGGILQDAIYLWDGNTWSTMVRDVQPTSVEWQPTGIFALASDGQNLYAGGGFDALDGLPLKNVARWDGTAWRPLGAGLDHNVWSFALSGPDVYVAGDFSIPGGSGVARWDGSNWDDMAGGVFGTAVGLALDGDKLYVTGGFTQAGGVQSSHFAEWQIGSKTSVRKPEASLPSRLAWNLFPNPSSGTLFMNLDLSLPSQIRVELFDLTGKSVGVAYAGQFNSGHYKLDLGRVNLPAGVYYARLYSTVGVSTRSILIVH